MRRNNDKVHSIEARCIVITYLLHWSDQENVVKLCSSLVQTLKIFTLSSDISDKKKNIGKYIWK